jgi:cystathionine gamma-synthase
MILICLSAILNPRAKHYEQLKAKWDQDYEDNYWGEDAIFLERNSRNFASRADKINQNAERICDLLLSHPRGIKTPPFLRDPLTCITVKDVFYPKHVVTRSNYDACRTERGGYGGLLSVTFHAGPDAVKFYDSIDVDKGPSLGTNFTLR